MSPDRPLHPPSRPRLPGAIWALGGVSLLMDVSSEMIHSLLPLFLVGTLGASVGLLGLLEGVAEATAMALKVFAGAWSDALGRRKPLALAGYGLGALAKPLFALALSPGWVFAARVLDRIGKGLRGAPRDALIAELAPPGMRGAAFGLRQALDSVGAFLGPALAIGLLLLWPGELRRVFWIAVLPALACVLLLAFAVREPPPTFTSRWRNPLRMAALRTLPTGYFVVVGIGVGVHLARCSEAFLLLRAEQLGWSLAWIPLVLVLLNIAYAASAYPAGWLADRMPATRLLGWSLLWLFAAHVALGLAQGLAGVVVGTLCWGLHLGFSQGLLATLVAATAPAELRGTAFGLFNLGMGLALLIASVAAGWLWDQFGAASAFAAGAVCAGLAALLLVPARRWIRL